MNSSIKNVLKILFFLGMGVALFWWVYKDMDFAEVKSVLNELNYTWLWASFAFALLSHISRAMRWELLINTLGEKPRSLNVFFAVMIMYLVNMLVPRSGELTRCGILKRYEKISFSKLLGTVVVERSVDMLLLFILAIVLLFSQFGVLFDFVNNNPEVKEKLWGIITNPAIWTILICMLLFGIAGIYIVLKNKDRFAFVQKIAEMLKNVFEGIKTVWQMEKKWLFIFHSIFIYLMYYAMTYACFWAFVPTENMALLAGLAVFVMGGFGMVAPVQAGIGAYHFMVMETLFIYGIQKTDGKMFALISHTSMNLFLLVAGVICFVLIGVLNKNHNLNKQ